MRKLLAIALCAMLWSPHAQADSAIEVIVPDAETVGNARLNVLFWDVYDAELKAPGGKWNPQEPYVLTLDYLREISGIDIADRSAEEIRALGMNDEIKLAAWHSAMRDIFPDVEEGTELTGLYLPNAPTHFYHDNNHIGTIQDPDFGEWFFGIWLDENTSKPEIREQLLGLK